MTEMHVRAILNEPFTGITNGWSLRYVNLLKQLADTLQLHVFLPGDGAALQAHLPQAIVHGTGDERRAPEPKRSLPAFLSSLWRPRADNLQIMGFHFYPSLFERLQSDPTRYAADVFFHTSSSIFYGAAASSPIRISDFCDSRIRSLKSQISASRSLKSRLMLRLEVLYTRRLKQRLIPADVKVVAITERDCQEIRQAMPGQQVYCVPNGVHTLDRQTLKQDLEQRHASRQIIFFGTLNFAPNMDAVRRLLQDIWPAVLAQRPELELVIVGRHPPDWLMEMAATTPGARIEANVPQIEPYLRHSYLSVCPMFMGAGMKNKILESLGMGLPIVATAEAVAGIQFVDQHTGWLAEGERRLAQATIDAFALDAADYSRICLQAHELAQRNSWRQAAAPILDLIRAGNDTAPPPAH